MTFNELPKKHILFSVFSNSSDFEGSIIPFVVSEKLNTVGR